jgi:exopolysaccharide biosynthesis protein
MHGEFYMLIIKGLRIIGILVLCAFLIAGFIASSSNASPLTTPMATPSVTFTASPTPSPSPSPTPSPTPSPSPTPTPTPAPTPDPWAAFFSETPVIEITHPYSLKETYIYKDKDLSISISVLMRNSRENYVAEIYTRGTLFHSGFANPKNPKTTKKPWYIARTYKAVFGVNSDYWNFPRLTMSGTKEIKAQKGIIMRNGEVILNKQDNEILAVLPSGELRIFEKNTITVQQLTDMGVKDTYSFGPVLVRDGKINPDMKNHIVYKAIGKGKNERCSIGMVEPGHYFVVISRNVTLDQVAQIQLELGSKLAYNLDGGNSSAMVFMGEQINAKIYDASLKTGQRSITDLIMIGTSDKVPGLKDPVHGSRNSN